MREDVDALRELARKQNLLIMVMAPNPASLPYSLRKGFAAKPSELKPCKSGRSGLALGLVQCPPELFASVEEWRETKATLASLGYEILGEEYEYLVRRKDGKLFYSDYDLLGLYNASTGLRAYSEWMRQTINARLGRRLVRHGPLDEYEQRAQIQVKFPVIAIHENGGTTEVNSESELRKIYRDYGLTWPW